jgi:LysM repeat protein
VPYYRRRKRQRIRRLTLGLGALAVLAGGGWWWFYGGGENAPAGGDAAVAAESVVARNDPPAERIDPVEPPKAPARLVADEEVIKPASPAETSLGSVGPVPRGPVSADDPVDDPAAARAHVPTRTGNTAIEAARRLLDQGRTIEARHQLNALLGRGLSVAEQEEVRALLTRVCEATLFSATVTPGDPLVETYVVQAGDVLIRIGRQFDVPAEALMMINGIRDARTIREGQPLKIPRGPFHVKIDKSDFRLDVYLGDLYVRSYRVGLGAGGGTPAGAWRVKERLTNPTYYPPASAGEKRIVAADDPENPLGEHWIGLEGIDDQTRGHEGYGIHGTIEPESIGQAVSMGCVRMHNEEVAQLYQLLLPGRSLVTIQP